MSISVSVIMIFSFFFSFFFYLPLSSNIFMLWTWDSMSTSLSFISIFIVGMIFLLNENYKSEISIILIMLMLAFNTKHLFYYFIYFEISMFPILFIVLVKGSQPERLMASTSIFMFTVLSAVPLLYSLMMLLNNNYTLIFFLLAINSKEIILMMTISFIVKIPIWPFHSWLPRAHVEAPVGGSMILAALMLKLGSYGLFRLFSMVNPFYSKIVLILASSGLMGMIISILSCLSTVDMKVLIAYSSIFHMSPMLMLIMNFNSLAFSTLLILSLSHALSSSLLFFIANLFYKNSKTRLLAMNSGAVASNSLLSFMMSIAITINLGVPPFASFFSEMLVFMLLFMKSPFLLLFIIITIILSSFYNFMLLISTISGTTSNFTTENIFMSEILIFMLHIIFMMMFIFMF